MIVILVPMGKLVLIYYVSTHNTIFRDSFYEKVREKAVWTVPK